MPKPTGTYHHGDLRAALLDEAAAMVTEGGVASVTLRELGRRLGVSRSAPYRHFANKTALLIAVAAGGFYRLKQCLRTVDAAAPGSGVERLMEIGAEYVRFAIANPAHYRLMYGREALARQDRPQLREAANAIFDQLVVVFQAHQRSGAIKRQDPRLQTYVAWSAMHGLASLWLEGQIQATDDIEQLIRNTTSTVLEGMRARRKRGA